MCWHCWNPKMQAIDSQKSCVLRIVRCIYCLISLFSILDWIEWIYERPDATGRRERRLAFWVVELWILGLLFLEVLVLVILEFDQWYLAATCFAAYVLLDALRAGLRDTIISLTEHRDHEGEYISIRNRPRWLILALLGAVEIILAFAILIRSNAKDFKVAECLPPIDALAAVYQSTLTFTTLGYGEIIPRTSLGRFLVTAELIYFLLFLSVRLPVAVAVARVRIADDTSSAS